MEIYQQGGFLLEIIGSWFEFVWEGEGREFRRISKRCVRVSGFSIFQTCHCWFPMLPRILIYLLNLKIKLASLSLSPLLSLAFDEGNKAKFVILHGIIRTREPLRPIHTIHYTRQGYLLRGCSFAYEAHPSPLPLVSLFTDTCSFHWHDARITEEDKPRTEDRSKI